MNPGLFVPALRPTRLAHAAANSHFWAVIVVGIVAAAIVFGTLGAALAVTLGGIYGTPELYIEAFLARLPWFIIGAGFLWAMMTVPVCTKFRNSRDRQEALMARVITLSPTALVIPVLLWSVAFLASNAGNRAVVVAPEAVQANGWYAVAQVCGAYLWIAALALLWAAALVAAHNRSTRPSRRQGVVVRGVGM